MSHSTLMGVLGMMLCSSAAPDLQAADPPGQRPNILFCIADDWGWPHAGSYGDPVVKTPTFDRLAREGVLFEQAYVSVPSCTPSRNSILTGQHFWALDRGATLYGTLDVKHPTFPLVLAQAGYLNSRRSKCWGPGDLKPGGYTDSHPAGNNYGGGLPGLIKKAKEGRPFCFWLGSTDPHRSYKAGSGKASGMNLDKIPVPKFWPNVEEVRSDIADYYFEVQRFDRQCGAAIALIEQAGLLENTIIVMTGDHGMPFPRCKANLYDMGVRVPLAIRWGAKVEPNRRITDFVSLIDLAPTFLQAAGVEIPPQMHGRSLVPMLCSGKNGRVEADRDAMVFGKERHALAQEMPSMDGYPCRGIRNDRFLYIRNHEPERWPAGVPANSTLFNYAGGSFTDCDPGPTRSYLLEHRDDPELRPFYNLSFAKRPAEELYDVREDPDQIVNLATDPKHEHVKTKLAARLDAELERTGDPRATGAPVSFDNNPYYNPRLMQKLEKMRNGNP